MKYLQSVSEKEIKYVSSDSANYECALLRRKQTIQKIKFYGDELFTNYKVHQYIFIFRMLLCLIHSSCSLRINFIMITISYLQGNQGCVRRKPFGISTRKMKRVYVKMIVKKRRIQFRGKAHVQEKEKNTKSGIRNTIIAGTISLREFVCFSLLFYPLGFPILNDDLK